MPLLFTCMLIIYSGDELLLTEMMFNGLFNDLTVEQATALLSCFVFQENVRPHTHTPNSSNSPYKQMLSLSQTLEINSWFPHFEAQVAFLTSSHALQPKQKPEVDVCLSFLIKPVLSTRPASYDLKNFSLAPHQLSPLNWTNFSLNSVTSPTVIVSLLSYLFCQRGSAD